MPRRGVVQGPCPGGVLCPPLPHTRRLAHIAVLRRVAGSILILAHRQHPRARSRTLPQPARTHHHHAGTALLRTQCRMRRSHCPRSSLPMPHAPLPLPSVLFAPQHVRSASFFMQDLTRRSHRPRWPHSTHSAFFLFRVPTLFLAGRSSFFLLAAHCVARHACSHARSLARARTDDRRTNDATCGPPAWLTGLQHEGGIRSTRSPLRWPPLLATPIAMPLQGGRPKRSGLLVS